MRSTPGYHQDQLLVERYSAYKINKVEYPLPENIVTVRPRSTGNPAASISTQLEAAVAAELAAVALPWADTRAAMDTVAS